jgi:hypothetical protein
VGIEAITELVAMAVYVYDPKVVENGQYVYYLLAGTLDELHSFARMIQCSMSQLNIGPGLPHYRLSHNQYAAAKYWGARHLSEESLAALRNRKFLAESSVFPSSL